MKILQNRLLPILSPDLVLNGQIWFFYTEKWIFLKRFGCFMVKSGLLKNLVLCLIKFFLLSQHVGADGLYNSRHKSTVWTKVYCFFSLVGYTLCHQQLAMPGVTDIWKVALQDGYCVQLFRDEVIMFHKEFQNLLDGMKG